MTFEQILTLKTIVETGSFRAAALAMNKSQPSISQAIKKLEEEYQIIIFDRSSYRASLTTKGHAFYLKAKENIDFFNQLDTFAKELSAGVESEVKISIEAICPLSKLTPFFEGFSDPKKTTSLDLNVDLLSGLQYKVKNHMVDFAIGSKSHNDDEIEVKKLMPIKMIPIMSGKLMKKHGLTLKVLQSLPQIVLNSSAKKEDTKIFGKLHGTRHWFTSDIYMKEQIISNGLGWGRLPYHMVKDKILSGELKEITGIEKVEALSVSIYLLKSKTKVLGPISKELWNSLVNID